jgi:hypothetical protein
MSFEAVGKRPKKYVSRRARTARKRTTGLLILDRNLKGCVWRVFGRNK